MRRGDPDFARKLCLLRACFRLSLCCSNAYCAGFECAVCEWATIRTCKISRAKSLSRADSREFKGDGELVGWGLRAVKDEY